MRKGGAILVIACLIQVWSGQAAGKATAGAGARSVVDGVSIATYDIREETYEAEDGSKTTGLRATLELSSDASNGHEKLTMRVRPKHRFRAGNTDLEVQAITATQVLIAVR
jgi:hypothetical protein